VRVTVKLFATFRKGRFDVDVREVSPGTTVSRIAGEVGLPEKEIGIVLVNGRHADLSKALSDGDTLAIFPLVGGG
jgi:molybdopterin converting factor small subunit